MKETKTFNVGNTYYCSYCLNEAKLDMDIDYDSIVAEYYCDCDNANKELRIKDKKLELEIELRTLENKCLHGDRLEEFKLLKQLEKVQKRLNKNF
jgi:hypothetical protein